MQSSMMELPTQTRSASQRTLDSVKETIGFVPNLFATLARQPGVVEAFVALDTAFSEASLTPEERQVVLLTASVENGGSYCVAGHTLFSRKLGVAESTIAAIRAAEPIGDERLDALQSLVRKLIQERGHATEQDLAEFALAGFTREQVLEVIMGISLKVMSNYVDSAMGLALDEPFKSAAWSAGA